MTARFSVRTGSVATTAAATKSLILLNPAGNELVLVQIAVSFDASTAAAGIGIELFRTTTLGSPAGTTGTIVKWNPASQAADTTALTALTTEPTAVEVMPEWFVSNTAGLDLQYPLGREPVGATAGARLGIRYITASGVSPNVRAYMVWEE